MTSQWVREELKKRSTKMFRKNRDPETGEERLEEVPDEGGSFGFNTEEIKKWVNAGLLDPEDALVITKSVEEEERQEQEERDRLAKEEEERMFKVESARRDCERTCLYIHDIMINHVRGEYVKEAYSYWNEANWSSSSWSLCWCSGELDKTAR